MTYKELYDKALWDLEHDNMTLGEFDRITEPLNKEIPKEEQTDGDLISRDYEIQQIQKAKESNYNFNYDTLIDFIKVLPSAEKTVNKININERVKVKLTDYGKDIFYHQYDNFNKTYGKEIINPYYPTVDSDGYTSFQLWRFMNLYGSYIDMDMQNVIEPLEIVFEGAEKTAKWILFDEDKNVYECSSCKEPFILMADTPKENNYNYCPNCGEKMKGK